MTRILPGHAMAHTAVPTKPPLTSRIVVILVRSVVGVTYFLLNLIVKQKFKGPAQDPNHTVVNQINSVPQQNVMSAPLILIAIHHSAVLQMLGMILLVDSIYIQQSLL